MNSVLQLVYTSHPNWPLGVSESQPRESLRISVLDSSFNPPTLAHLVLVNSHLPPEWNSHETIDYDAKLLLFSVKNVDKAFKPGDASHSQRLEMMSLLTRRVTSANVAIAITSEPTFVRKSEALLAFFNQKFSSSQTQPPPTIELTFLVGLDTLERLFSPRYYPSQADMRASLHKFLSPCPEGDNSRVVSAMRIFTPIASQASVDTPSAADLINHYLDSGRIAIVDIGKELSAYSSSAVRSAIAQGGLTPTSETGPVWCNSVTAEIAKYIVEEQLYAAHSSP